MRANPKSPNGSEGERLHAELSRAGIVGAMLHDDAEYEQSAHEFSRPYRERITELEKRLAELAETPTVDGKTPGQVGFEAWTKQWSEIMGEVPAEWSREISFSKQCEEASAQAVLRAFGQSSQTTQDAVEALQRVRDRINADDLDSFNVAGSLGLGPNAAITKFGVRRIVDDEIAKLEAKPAPTSSHVHEIGSCSHCDKGDASHNKINREVTQ